jgi:putative flippase GtrA
MKRARPSLRESVRFLRAQLSALAATAADWGLMTLLVASGVHYLLGSVAGSLLGAGTDFALKRSWAFGAAADPAGRQAARYGLVSLASAGWNALAAYLLVDGLGAPEVPGVIAASVVVGLVWNYPLHRFYVFASPPKPLENA